MSTYETGKLCAFAKDLAKNAIARLVNRKLLLEINAMDGEKLCAVTNTGNSLSFFMASVVDNTHGKENLLMDSKAIGEISGMAITKLETIAELARGMEQFNGNGHENLAATYHDVLLTELENVQLLVIDLTELVTGESLKKRDNGNRERSDD